MQALRGGRRLQLPGTAGFGAALALAALAAVGGASAWLAGQGAARGAQLFDGRLPLQAQIQGHEARLPPSASRCSNCHEVAHRPPAQATQAADGPGTGTALPLPPAPPASTARYGPALGPALLAVAQARRGGPPSRYDAASLCQLLRTGIDPAWVMLPQVMPRYQLSDADCMQLWAYLSS